MNPSAVAAAAFEEMATQKVRTALSMLSVVVGVLAITWTVALGDMGTAAVTVEIEQAAGREATVRMDLQRAGAPILLTRDLRERLEARLHRYGIREASPISTVNVQIREGARVVRVGFNGVNATLGTIRRLPLLAGRWLTERDSAALIPLVVVNRTLLDQLGAAADPVISIGRRLRLEMPTPVEAVVVGVIAGRPGDGAELFGPIEALERWSSTVPSVSFYLLRVDPIEVSTVQSILTFDISRWNADLYPEMHRVDTAAEFKQVITLLQLVMSAVASVALLAGALGIMNLGLVTVRQRTREFGIHRAFGATRAAIFQLVLAETVMTTLVAGLAGVTIAIATSPILARIVGVNLDAVGIYVPLRAALLGLGVSILVGVLAGLVPARRATAIDVVEAIRQ